MLDKLKHYGLMGTLKIIYSLIYTKLFFSHAKLIRLPIDIRGKKFISFENGFTTGFYCRLETYNNGTISFGKNCQINDFVHIASGQKIAIGDDCLIASKVFITDLNHGVYDGEECSSPYDIAIERELVTKPVVIGNNVWIGESCSILPGVTIGNNVIVGANSVVTHSFPENTIVAGNPARIIKYWNKDSLKWMNINNG